MTDLALTACERKNKKKRDSKLLRKSGAIPAVLYGKGDSTPLIIKKKDLSPVLKLQAQGMNRVFTLNLQRDNGDSIEKTIMIKELQYHPITIELFHADLIEIDLSKKIIVKVPIKIVGELAATKKGGILNVLLREVKVECLPTEIPKHLTVDATNLETGHSIHLKDLTVEKNITLCTNLEETVITLTVPKAEKVKEEDAEAGADEEAKKTDGV